MKNLSLVIFHVLALNFFSVGYATTLRCEFSLPGKMEQREIPIKLGDSRFELIMGEFLFSLDLFNDQIMGIKINDNARGVSSQTIATTGAGIFAKPRQLSLESGDRFAEVNCW